MSDLSNPTRRSLFTTGLALGATALTATAQVSPHPVHGAKPGKAVPFQFGKEPKRVRKSFHDLTDDEVTAFTQAVGFLRDGLPIHDPRQWDNLVSTHAVHCTEAGTGTGVFQVHWSWFFLPWHRAYLFFIERHLADVLKTQFGDKPVAGDAFSLPYWDWVGVKGVPNTALREKAKKGSPFFGLDLTTDFDPASVGDPLKYNMGLFNGYRGPTADKPGMDPANEPTEGWKEYTRLIRDNNTSPAQIASILAQPNFCIFGGHPATDAATGQGLMESIPHNTIHDWVGGRFGRNRDMGNLRYAGLDPIFYLHHANIDRLWSLYQHTPDPDKPPTAVNCVTDPDQLNEWANKTFEFLDVDGSVKSVSVRDTVKNMTTISYSPPKVDHPLVTAAVDPKSPKLTERVATLHDRTVKADAAKTLTGTQPGTFTVPVAKLKVAAADVRAGAPKSAVLEIEVSDFEYDGRFQVRVFANKPDADHATKATDEHFVGSFQVLNSHSKSAKKKHLFYVDVSPGVSNFFKVSAAGKPLQLTLVAHGGGKAFAVTVAGVKLRVSE